MSINDTPALLMMQDNSKPEECTICFGTYDEILLRPRSLPCGHAFCSQCIERAIKNGQVACPSCRAEHIATTATQFPINYGMEAFVRKLASVGTVSAKRSQDPPIGIGKKLRSLVQEQKSNISSLITSCEDTLCQLGEYRGQLRDRKTRHHQLQDKLDGLVEQNKTTIELLEQEDTSVVDMTAKGEDGKKRLQVMLGNLEKVYTAHEVDTIADRADQCHVEVKEWLHECQDIFPDFNALHTSVKVQETIKEAQEIITPEAGAATLLVHPRDSATNIMEKVWDITRGVPLEEITIEHLRRMSEPVKRLVVAGQVVAVEQKQDGCHFSKITLQDGELFLHPLLRQALPIHARSIQHSDIVNILDYSSTMAFLDLAWAGSTKGRVAIWLTPDTGLARQFVLLCMGLQGPTYTNTKFFEVEDKDQPGECMVGGDYETNDGEGGTSLLPDLGGEYRRSSRAGAVGSWWGPEDHRSAQFYILTRDLPEGQWCSRVFGEVASGLDVLRAATSHGNITEVTVVDCGIVLPL